MIAAGWILVTSSNVAGIRWRDGHEYGLEVKFLNGAEYAYRVPFEVYDAMFAASSQGRFVWRVLRAGGYPYRRLA